MEVKSLFRMEESHRLKLLHINMSLLHSIKKVLELGDAYTAEYMFGIGTTFSGIGVLMSCKGSVSMISLLHLASITVSQLLILK